MRLRRLDLIRYGKFADVGLDFGPAGRASDVTVVFGNNEAGKSTAFAAWLDLLFGLPQRTPAAFRFERKELMIGATIETGDETLTLRRTGTRRDSLTDDSGRAIAESRMTQLLYGLDRDAYRTRFSLDDAVLRDGGEEIARARGDLGRLLHAGTSGLSGLTDALDEIESGVDAFHKKGGRATALAEGKRRLKEIEAALRDARLDPRRFDELSQTRDAAAAELDTAEAALRASERLFGLRQAADRRRRLAVDIDERTEVLAACPDGPELPEGAVADVVAADERRSAAEKAVRQAEEALGRARTAQNALPADPDGLRVADLLATLDTQRFDDGEPLLARVQTAAADIGRRQQARDMLAAEERRLTDAIGAAPGNLRLSRAQLAGLRTAAEAVREAARAEAQHRDGLAKSRALLGPDIDLPEGLDTLEDALEARQRAPDDAEALTAEAEAAQLAAARAAAGLPDGWRALAGAGLPDEAELAALVSDADRAAARVEDATARLDEAEEAQAEARRLRDAAEGRGDTVTDAAIRSSRAGRDAAWRRHLDGLGRATADAFEAAMRQDDELRGHHAAGTEARLHLAQCGEEVLKAESLLRRRGDQRAAALEARAAILARVAGMAARLGLPDTAAPAALQPRRTALATALDLALAAEAALRAATALKMRLTALDGGLAEALEGAGAPAPDPRRLVPEAVRLRTALRARADQARAHRKAADGIAHQSADLRAAEADSQRAGQDLARLTSGLFCDGWTCDRVLMALPNLEDLAGKARERQDIDSRIAAMQAALDAFAAASRDMAAFLGMDPSASATDLLAAACARATAARRAEDERAALARTIAASEEARRAARVAIGEADAEIAEVLAGQACDPGTPPRQAIHRLDARDRTRAELRQLKRERARAGEGTAPEALAREEADTDPLRTARLEDELAQARAGRDAALTAKVEADKALRDALAGAGGAALDQERAALLEGLREGARTEAARLLGLMAAQGALRRFRQDRRGPMLEATERAFARLTHGEWARLEAQSMGRTERLVGIRDGTPVAADAMSTGTRAQLYLALRIAGHADFVARNGPLPFITDDIHESFDDRRAGAALELTAEMGRLGQAILFTHHRHLVGLARAAIPDVNLVELA